MAIKINSVLLIDDDETTNFIHERVIKKAGITENIIKAENGKVALDYLKETNSKPDLIFVDLNMPVLNGWEFLEQYRQLDEVQKGKVVIIMLTTDVNPYADTDKAPIHNFLNKPLTSEALNKILQEYFTSD